MQALKAGMLGAVLFAMPSWAEGEKAPPPGEGPPAMDMSKMGPMTRKAPNEKEIKKEIDAFFKEQEALSQKHDLDGQVARVDFPVYMLTDDAKGAIEGKSTTKEQYVEMMKPFYEKMPKDMKTSHKTSVAVLSDAIVEVTDDFAMTMGKQKMTGRNVSLLVKVDGKWKWKVMAEAGWGGMSPPEKHADK